MAVALEFWSRFPLEIEYDLVHEHNRHIREWHQGQMSSRELLVLIVYQDINGNSAYARALRDGDWSEAEYISAVTANELLNLRAGYHAVHGGEPYEPTLFLSPFQKTLEALESDGTDEARDQVTSQLQRW